MSDIETYYLIDFENVNEEGLSCSHKLKGHNHIHIFSTKNAPKISFSTLTSFNDIELCSHIVPAKKQSLDMHLVSYLGYLIGKNGTNKCKYIIVSKDNDYDNVISFFKELNSSNITRQKSIDQLVPNAANGIVNADSINITQAVSQNKTRLNTKIQQAVSNAGHSSSTSNKVASIVTKHCHEEGFLNKIHNELRGIFPNYSDIYKIIKPVITKYYSAADNNNETTASKNNNEFEKILKNAGFDNNVITYVVSLISKHHNEKNAKQAVYNSIVAKYGQKQGLNIYNHIKKSL